MSPLKDACLRCSARRGRQGLGGNTSITRSIWVHLAQFFGSPLIYHLDPRSHLLSAYRLDDGKGTITKALSAISRRAHLCSLPLPPPRPQSPAAGLPDLSTFPSPTAGPPSCPRPRTSSPLISPQEHARMSAKNSYLVQQLVVKVRHSALGSLSHSRALELTCSCCCR